MQGGAAGGVIVPLRTVMSPQRSKLILARDLIGV